MSEFQFYQFVWRGFLVEALGFSQGVYEEFVARWKDELADLSGSFWTEDPWWYVVPFAASKLTSSPLSSPESVRVEKIIAAKLKKKLLVTNFNVPRSFDWKELGDDIREFL